MFTIFSDGMRCFICSSQRQRNCGDPFFRGQIETKECDDFYTDRTQMCFKASQYRKCLRPRFYIYGQKQECAIMEITLQFTLNF